MYTRRALKLLVLLRRGLLPVALALAGKLNLAVYCGATKRNGHTKAIERADLNVEQNDAKEDGEALLDVAADSNGESAS